MNKITLIGRSGSDDLPDVSIGIDIQMHFSDDAPPTLVQAIGRSIAELMTAWGKSDELEQIARECEEICARRQRQADHATELLLSRPAGPAEASRPKRKTKNALADEIALHQCYRCDTLFGNRGAAGCSECRPIRVLIGSEKPEA